MAHFDDVKGFAFDLDGVLADTAKFHSQAWRQIAEELNITWTPELESGIKGIDRMSSLMLILNSADVAGNYTEEQKEALATRKNDHYKELIGTLTPDDVLPGMHKFLDELKANNLKMSIASASKNAPFILDKLQISDYFVGVVDPSKVKEGKPAPDIFAEAAKILDLDPATVVGLEDSAAGITSINAAGEISVGIGDKALLHEAKINFPSTADVTLAKIRAHLNW
ncbi:beta-phosphoglucomutase [Lapidilactobacillus bayanensis]|uniref:beta-phosphoglucomutase n=1 Tax=Lapidilactobacillus bayanensis TaxID=2485998 RepID=UPI000F782283|nr:beta-phosphoglucomutase [Lapidilactobacillus bayanensis]